MSATTISKANDSGTSVVQSPGLGGEEPSGQQQDSHSSTQVKTRPRYLLRITLLTVSYLIFELAFNARLLDVTGGMATRDQINIIEKIGRLISGVALTLVVWGQWIMPRAEARGWGPRGTRLLLATSALVCISCMFWIQKALIDRLVDAADGTSRRIAVQLRLVTSAVVAGELMIDGIEITPELLSRPEGKSFMALLPFMSFSTESLEKKAEAVLRSVIRNKYEKAVGTPQEAFNRLFVRSVHSIRDSFNTYAEGVNRYRRVLVDIPHRQEEAWSDYVRELRRKGVTPSSVPRWHWERVRRELYAKGVELPQGWNPANRAAFYAAVAKKIKTESERAFASELRKALGTGETLPVNLDWTAFQRHPSIQRRWREALGVKDNIPLEHKMDLETFREVVYEPQVSVRIEEDLRRLMAEDVEYLDGGRHGELGREAMQALIVPPIALAFSLLGALTHLFKSANYIIILLAPRVRFRVPVLLGLVSALALSAFLAPNEVTRSRVFEYFEQQTARRFFLPVAWAVRWVVQAQPFFYPINETIRTKVLMGINFGYKPVLLVSGGRATARNSEAPPVQSQPGLPDDADPALMQKQQVLQTQGRYIDRWGNLRRLNDRRLGCHGFELEAHRGHPERSENSPSAFAQALTAKYNGVETDAMTLADGTWVLHHDLTTDRTIHLSRGNSLVHSLNRADWTDGYYIDRKKVVTNERVKEGLTILSEATAIMSPGQRINIELKGVTCNQLRHLDSQLASIMARSSYGYSVMEQIGLLECIRKHNKESYVALIQSPNHKSLKQWLEHTQPASHPRQGSLLQRVTSSRFVQKRVHRLRLKDWTSPSAIRELKRRLGRNFGLHIDYRDLLKNPTVVKRLKKSGVKLMTYTINSPAEHIEGLKALKRRGALPSGAIVDSTVIETCQALGLE